MSSTLSAANEALKHPSVCAIGDVKISDDNSVKSSLEASSNCSAIVASTEPSHIAYIYE